MTRFRSVLVLALTLALIGALPALAGAVVSTGHSGWSWSNPSPQGENLSDITFSGSTGIAVGRFGTVLRTTDSGTTWTGLASQTVQDLTRVGPAGAGGFVTSGGCAVRRSADGGATLTSLDVGGGDTGCGTSVRAIAFADASNGLILFDSGVVLGTSDGGVSLSRRTPVPGIPSDLIAVSPTAAFATSSSGLYRTVDAGGSWTLLATTPRPLRAVTFATATVGYASGDGGTVLKSIDGGATWAPAPSPGAALDLSRVRCADALLCLFTTSTGASVVRTADGGATYVQVTASADPIRAVAFASATRAVGVGDGGTTVISDDGGVTWRTSSAVTATDVVTVHARSADFAYTVGPTAIGLTSDGGETWRSVGIPTPRAISVAAFADPLTGFVQDDGGTLRRTTNGGASWQILDPGAAAGALQRIVTLTPQRILLVTASGVARSVNGGDDVTVVSSATLRRSKVIRRGILSASGSGRRAFIVGRAGLLVSTNGGATWVARAVPRVQGHIPAIVAADCLAPSTCWVTTARGRLYRTTNLGARWIDVTPAVGLPLRSVGGIAAAGPREALLTLRNTPSPAGAQGFVLHTSDGGASWAPQLVNRNPVTALDAIGSRAWALAVGPPSFRTATFTTATGGLTAKASTLTIAASRRVVRRPTSITIRGRLRGAQGGEQVTLYTSGAPARVLTVASSGSFTATFTVRRTTTFVAQWAGDGVRSGDGTPALVVRRG